MSDNYILKIDHTFPFEESGKVWISYLPGFEGMYAVSDDYCILSIERIRLTEDGVQIKLKQRVLNKHISGSGGEYYIISKDAIHKSFTKLQLKEMMFPSVMIDTLPYRLDDKLLVMWIPGFEGMYAVSDECKVVQVKGIKYLCDRQVITSYKCSGRPNFYVFNKPGIRKTLSEKQVKKLLSIHMSN